MRKKSYLVTYDFSSSKAIKKAAELCQDCGLFRIQKSVFFGAISNIAYSSLTEGMNSLINGGQDSVFIFCLPREAIDHLICFPEEKKEDTSLNPPLIYFI